MCSRQVRNVQLTPDAPAVICRIVAGTARTARFVPRSRRRSSDAAARQAFTFVAEDTTGWSPGFDVRDDSGLEWSVKTGPEAQSEVVTSRILWGIGFHQPPTYYLESWSLKGARTGTQEPGRFRPDLPGHEVVGDWPWHENPFVGTPEYGGLIVANLLLTNWDWKTSNNKIYQLDKPVNGVTRWFMVRDLGASLGKFTYPTVLKWFRLRGFGQGTRNDLPGSSSRGLSSASTTATVEFDYKGIYRDVISTVTPEQSAGRASGCRSCRIGSGTTRFAAADTRAEQTARYTAKIKEKIAQGLQLTALGN